jgi:hypothetical protein
MTMVEVDPVAFGCDAVELAHRFAERDPIVMIGDHDAETGLLRLDPENLDEAGADEVVAAFRALARLLRIVLARA